MTETGATLVCHPSLRICFILWLSLRFESLGPVLYQSTGIWKPGYHPIRELIGGKYLLFLSSPGFCILQLGFRLPNHFCRSSKVAKETIMTDIIDLVQEFWRISSDRDIGASFFAIRRLYEISHRWSNPEPRCYAVYSSLPVYAADDRVWRVSKDVWSVIF